MNVNILGTDYKIKENMQIEDDRRLEDGEAYTDYTVKEIGISEFGTDRNSCKDTDFHIRKIKRHEIIHAFFYESGLRKYFDDEDLVDWLAVQYPKIKKVFEKLNIEK